MPEESVVRDTKKWVTTVVIGLNLCPFAKQVVMKNTVSFRVSDATTEEGLLQDIHDSFHELINDLKIETTLLILPNTLEDFGQFNQFLSLVDDLIVDMKLEGVFQVASFHPDYQFEGTRIEDVENYTNKSPYPILHILREDLLTDAIDSHPNVHDIPVQNKLTLRDIGADKMKALLQSCFEAE